MDRSCSVVFVEAAESAKAMIAYEKALQWRELMDLAERENTPQEDIEAMAYRVAGTPLRLPSPSAQSRPSAPFSSSSVSSAYDGSQYENQAVEKKSILGCSFGYIRRCRRISRECRKLRHVRHHIHIMQLGVLIAVVRIC